ncbi:hypothetical protein Tco_0704274 [Tanacetum coccineum]|uniref:Uncharacterized protein n=1 Tax=Tanacetum coccineum TaxID=301880 RepID=A0ABQ4Y381_9ASTR
MNTTPDSDWNVRKSVDFKPPQTWISKIAQAEKPPISFDELMTFNLLKRTFKSYVELKYNIEECYKAVTDQLEWNNPEGKEYLFDLSKPLPLIMERGRQVVPVDYFINNDLEHIVILKRVEDLQLGFESYQKKLNITKPQTFRSDISNRIPYTTYSNPQGIIFKDKYKRNRLMRTDEIYKFSDETLISVRTVLHNVASNMRMDYLLKRR